MRPRAILEVMTPHAGALHHMSGGSSIVDQVLAEAGLADQISQALETDDEAVWLRRCVYYLERRFQRWLQVRLIAPLSLPGLFMVVRYRIRTYPTFIMGGETYTGHNLAELEAFIRRQAGLMVDD
jgi:hypothetical protein